MSVLSIDVGSSHVTVAEGRVKKGMIEILQSVTAGMAADDKNGDDRSVSVADVSDTLAGLLHNIKFKSRKAIVTVNMNNIVIRDFTLPEGSAKQLTGMVRNEMIQNYSAGATDVIQYIKQSCAGASEPAKGRAKKSDATTGIRAVTVKRDMVDSYYNMLKKLRLTPVAMDFHANSIEKLVSGGLAINGKNLEKKSYIMIDFGSAGTLVHAVADDRIYVSRHIQLGVSDLENLIAERELIPLMQAKAFRQEKLNLLSDEEQQSPAMQATRNFLYQWSDELQKFVKFFLARRGVGAVDHLFIFGIGANIKGLPEYVTAAVGIDAQRPLSVSKITFKNGSETDLESKLSNCLNAAGALIRHK